jgi:hypothetical protein
LEQAKPRAKPDLPELGAPGNHFFRGFLVTDEYVPELTGQKGLETFERMRRSDGMITGSLRSMKQPILRAKYGIQPASQDESDATIANFVRWNLFEGMTTSFIDHIRESLTHLDFGYAICEKVWEVREDLRVMAEVSAMGEDADTRALARREVLFDKPMFVLRKLAPRLQRTIQKWNLADDGGLQSIEQAVYKGSGFKQVEIPVDKLLVFVNEKEGANWTGKSVLRPAYKHWFIKDQLYRIDAIAAERHGVGIPVMELPEGKSDTENMDRAEDILMGVRAHERGYVVVPFGYVFKVTGMGEGRAMNLLPIIQHHDRMIAVSVLAPQLALGENSQGSFAMHQGQDSFFMLTMRAIADHILDVHNRYLIPQLVNFNFSGVTRYPKLTIGAIETRDIEKLLNALTPAVNAGIITADDRLEDALRDLAELPERDPATARALKGANGAPQTPAAEPTPTPELEPETAPTTSVSENPEGEANA